MLRDYISRGLLPGPGRVGPGKHYEEKHMVQLETIRYMHKTHRTLNEIKEHMANTKPGELLKEWAFQQDKAVQQDLDQSKDNATRSILAKAREIFEPTKKSQRTGLPTPDLNSVEAEENNGLWWRFQVSEGIEILICQDLAMGHQSELMTWIETGSSIFSHEGRK